MTRAEIVVVVTLAGPEAERRLPFAERRTRRGIAVHEAAHCIAALRFGVPVFRVVVEDDRGVTEYVENAGSGKPLEDNELARGELSRDEVLTVARWSSKVPSGPPSPAPATAVTIAR